MNKWVIGARVKTLPAAVSPVLIGTFYASEVNWINALLALIVSLSLQIAVNYANDYSDGIRGTDTDRVGPIRLVASGLASAKLVKRASYISFLFAVVAGSLLSLNISLWLLPVGGISILAAWGYTGGKQPYGYLGFGEFSVFIFFGLVATVGSYYVQSEQLNWQILLLSVPVGLLSCAILVINNLRDLPKDALVSKRTVAVRIGDINTRKFFAFLLITAQLAALSAIGIDQLVVLTLVCLPFTYQVVKQVLGGAKDAALITVLNNTARLQLLMSALIATALYI
jgi:1,4-dihydroxy-2-naphthoate octaprenyltransferase